MACPAHTVAYVDYFAILSTTFTLVTMADPDNNNNNNNNNNSNNQVNVYGAVIMAEPLRKFTRFI